MSYSENDIIKLKDKISVLENENRRLKKRLTEAGFSYGDILGECDEEQEGIDALYDPNQGARIRRLNVTDEHAGV